MKEETVSQNEMLFSSFLKKRQVGMNEQMNKTCVSVQVSQTGQSKQTTQRKSKQVCWVKQMSQTETNQNQVDLNKQVKHRPYVGRAGEAGQAG